MLTWPGKCCGPTGTICFNVTSCGLLASGASIAVKDSGGTTVASGTTNTSGQYCTPTLTGTGFTWTVSIHTSGGLITTQTGTANAGDTENIAFLCAFGPPNTPSSGTLVDSLWGTVTLTYGLSPVFNVNGFQGNQTASVMGIPIGQCSTTTTPTTISCPVYYLVDCSGGFPRLQIYWPICQYSVTQIAPTSSISSPATSCVDGPFFPSSLSNDTCSGLNATFTVPAGSSSLKGCNNGTGNTTDIYNSGATINFHF